MIIIVHSEMSASKVATSLGVPEYSYHFVLKSYWPVLERFGMVVTVSDPEHEVDAIWRGAARHGQDSVFLSFAPPHRTYVNVQCPTIPVVAWEFDTIPSEVWDDDPRNDWRTVLRRCGQAITHSEFAVKVFKDAMGDDFPIVSIPAPVWDRFDALYQAGAEKPRTIEISVSGPVVDSREIDLSAFPESYDVAMAPLASKARSLQLDGMVYCACFNPHDSRKNWSYLMAAFCLAFRDASDATLVMKLSHHDSASAKHMMLFELSRLMPFKCRVIIIDTFISNEAYERLVAGTTYIVNTSSGEGQCLPLMEFMSAGKPAIAPTNTAMADYISAENSFILRSSLEPCWWPHDPRLAFRANQHRIDFGTLLQAYRNSYRVGKHEPERYARMGEDANGALRAHCSCSVAQARFGAFLNQIKIPSLLRAEG